MVGHHFGSTYCAAKAAILGFTKSWAKELAPHQHHGECNRAGWRDQPDGDREGWHRCGARADDKGAAQRWAEPEEIAQGMLYLVTAGFVTGQMLSLNGGDTIVGI